MNKTSFDPSDIPIRSPRYDTAVKGILTDTQIFRYMLQGLYGKDAQLRAEFEQRVRAATHKGKAELKKKVKDLLEDL